MGVLLPPPGAPRASQSIQAEGNFVTTGFHPAAGPVWMFRNGRRWENREELQKGSRAFCLCSAPGPKALWDGWGRKERRHSKGTFVLFGIFLAPLRVQIKERKKRERKSRKGRKAGGGARGRRPTGKALPHGSHAAGRPHSSSTAPQHGGKAWKRRA